MAAGQPERARGRGHAKVIVAGEHFVLHGSAALAIALPGLHTEVELRRRPAGNGIVLSTRAELSAPQRTAAMRMIGTAAGAAGLAPDVAVRVTSSIPIGSGLGSSAALAVALLAAAEQLAGRSLSGAGRLDACRRIEAVVHGRSSGLDPAASMSGGAVLFAGGRVEARVAVAPTAAMRAARWVLIDAGGAPGTVVAVGRSRAALRAMGSAAADRLVRVVDRAARGAADALEGGDVGALAAAMRACAAALARVDVRDERMAAIASAALDGGARAVKQTGAGLGGMMLALAPDVRIAETVAHTVRPLARSSRLLEIAP